MNTGTAQIESNNNKNKAARAQAALAEVLATSLTRGFYGTAGIVVVVQDGCIQNIRLQVDRRMS